MKNLNNAMVVAGLLLGCPAALWAQSGESSRGELLYNTYCVACHTTEIHWRDKKAATDWESLRSEVMRWQATAGLGWDSADVQRTAAYLNRLFYHFPEQEK